MVAEDHSLHTLPALALMLDKGLAVLHEGLKVEGGRGHSFEVALCQRSPSV